MNQLIIMVGLALLPFSAAWSQSSKQVFYVSPTGSDRNAGTLSRPFASLEKALDAAGASTKPTEIILREGTHLVHKSLTITRSNLHIKAHPNEHPVISGGKTIQSNWEKVEGTRWKTQVPDYFRQLFVNDSRAIRARFPNAGKWASQWYQPDTVQVKQKRLVLNRPLPAHFADLKGVEMHATAYWHWLRQKVERFDPAQNAVITVTEPSPECSSTKMGTMDRIYFENHLAFLDADTEWFLDSLSRTLYYQSARKPDKQTFVYPVIETIFFVRGTEQKPVTNFRLEGVTIAHTEWSMPGIERKGIQAGYWGTERGKPVFAPPAAVMMNWVTEGEITNCFFNQLGEGAIVLGDGCHKNRVQDNRFEDVGANVIQVGRRTNYVGEGHPLHYVPKNLAAVPSANVIHNNHLKTFATTDLGSVGICITYAHHNQVTHNLLEDFPYTGISMGWRWDTLENHTYENLIEWNETRNGMQYLSDGGGIYTAGRQAGSKILNNWIHGMGGGPLMSEGMYNDEGGSYFELGNNHVERVKHSSYKFHQNILKTVDIHDNNGQRGKNELKFINRNVSLLELRDSHPANPKQYGLLKK
ncbi:hypothetical protein ACFPMF_10750 [Larkinella bovis]|uniref:GH141-like insertion domain-containing protein n=1 Tax=Larkinella bovis TaxID=683041 RepID=A0ABW0IA71_9BACT